VKAQVRLKRTDREGNEVERERTGERAAVGGDATRDEHGRLRRLWRRATGNGPVTPGAPVDEREPPDDLDENE
jgi:hypothetical protein